MTGRSVKSVTGRPSTRVAQDSAACRVGRRGDDYLSYITIVHGLVKVDASHAITVSAHTTLGTSLVVDFGTGAQRRRYVPGLATGKVLGGFGPTEPGNSLGVGFGKRQ